jgi:hypothetical protein
MVYLEIYSISFYIQIHLIQDGHASNPKKIRMMKFWGDASLPWIKWGSLNPQSVAIVQKNYIIFGIK